MSKRILTITAAVIGLALYAAHMFDILGLVRAMHGR
jgi:hypothetical protein